jgi:hypothetical protein
MTTENRPAAEVVMTVLHASGVDLQRTTVGGVSKMKVFLKIERTVGWLR